MNNNEAETCISLVIGIICMFTIAVVGHCNMVNLNNADYLECIKVDKKTDCVLILRDE